MRAALIWLAVVLFLVLLLRARVGIWVSYEKKRFQLRLVLGSLRLSFPKGKKKPEEAPEPASPPLPKKKGNPLENPWVKAALDYRRELLALIGRVLKSPTLDVLRLELEAGGTDAGQCALRYGWFCAAIGSILPLVENTFGIRKRSIQVRCRYDLPATRISAEAAITLRIYEIFALAFALLGLGIKLYLQARKYKAV